VRRIIQLKKLKDNRKQMSTPDINSLDLQEEFVEVPEGSSAESFYQFDLLDDGRYIAVVRAGNRGVVDGKKKKDNSAMVTAHVQAVILDDSGNESKQSVFDQINSAMMPSKGMSSIHAFMEMAGHKLPSRVSISSNGQPSQMAELVTMALAQSPKVGIRTEWQASYKVENEEVASKVGKKVEEYVTFLKGQKKFPPMLDSDGNVTGKFSREVVDPKTGVTGKAQVKIVEYFKA